MPCSASEVVDNIDTELDILPDGLEGVRGNGARGRFNVIKCSWLHTIRKKSIFKA